MVREQFSSSCSKELAVYLMERYPKDLEELSDFAEQYLIVHGKRLSARTSHDAKKMDAMNIAFNKDKQVLWCFSCQGVGHRVCNMTIFAIDLKNSTIKFTILTEVDSQQQSFPPLCFKNVTIVYKPSFNKV